MYWALEAEVSSAAGERGEHGHSANGTEIGGRRADGEIEIRFKAAIIGTMGAKHSWFEGENPGLSEGVHQ